MDRKVKGNLAEVLVLAKFIELGYHPFTPFVSNTKHDLLVVKDSQVYRVSTKFTAQSTLNGKSWIVSLRNTHSDKNGIHTKPFTPDEYDFLAVYIQPENRVVLIDVNFKNTNTINIPALMD